MASIDTKRFIRCKKRVLRKHEGVVSYYLFGKPSDEPILQINMYGRDTRQDSNPPKEKASQVIQFDENTARCLIKQFEECFKWKVTIKNEK